MSSVDFDLLPQGTLPWTSIVRIVGILGVAYTVYGAIYRLYLSPVSHIPGPFLARLTYWNEFYYDCVKGGRYTWEIEKYHAKYGPIIRVNPEEVHVMDKDFVDELYVSGRKRKSRKWDWTMRLTGLPEGAMFATVDHDLHRVRREPWNPYFSKLSVTRAQPHIQNVVGQLCDKFAQARETGTVINISHAYACVTLDVISEFTFPEGYHYLDRDGFDGHTHDAYMSLAQMTHFMKHVRGLAFVLQNLIPISVAKFLDPGVYSILQNEALLHRQTKELVEQRQHNASLTQKQISGRPSLVDAFLDAKLPPGDKSVKVLASNALTVIGAGTLTTAHTLRMATFHILSNPAIHARLMNELKTLMPDPASRPSLRELESVEYLVAIINESLRLAKIGTQRNQRLFDVDVFCKDIKLPAGTPIGMTGGLMCDLPEIYPDPYTFDPERWLPLATTGAKQAKYFFPFGRGSRSCVGIELAKSEMLNTLAMTFRRFGEGMKLVDTVRERDVDIVRDYFFSLTTKEGNGVLVRFEK